jgi:IclR family acetate operon transcriptional repressor
MRSLERALGVLTVLEQSRQPLRLSEIARRADLHVATAQRILGVLERFDYVGQDGNGYIIGVASLLNAHSFLLSNTLSRAATPILQELAHACGLTALLSIRVGFSRVLIGRVDGSSPLRYQLPVGERMPLHLGSGRVFAAAMSPGELSALLEEVGEIRLATGQTVTRAEFIERLREIREQGYAVGFSERALGAASIGMPVFGLQKEVLGIVQLAGLVEDVNPAKIDWYVSEMKRATTALAERVAGQTYFDQGRPAGKAARTTPPFSAASSGQ